MQRAGAPGRVDNRVVVALLRDVHAGQECIAVDARFPPLLPAPLQRLSVAHVGGGRRPLRSNTPHQLRVRFAGGGKFLFLPDF